MPRFVLDAIATLAWLFDEDGAAGRLGPLLAAGDPVAPWIWRLEVVNAVLVSERRKLLTAAQSGRLLGLLDEWNVETIGEPEGRPLSALAQTARPHQMSAYDATYLELAVSLGLPLCTLDGAMQRAAKSLGIPLTIEPNRGSGP